MADFEVVAPQIIEQSILSTLRIGVINLHMQYVSRVNTSEPVVRKIPLASSILLRVKVPTLHLTPCPVRRKFPCSSAQAAYIPCSHDVVPLLHQSNRSEKCPTVHSVSVGRKTSPESLQMCGQRRNLLVGELIGDQEAPLLVIRLEYWVDIQSKTS